MCMDKGKAKYLELVNWIKEQIAQKELIPGQKMYSENELSGMFHLSRQTVRHAIGILESEGILRRIQGSGTYINDDRLANLENKKRIAVITTYVDGYIFPRTIQGIENTLSDWGYSVQIAFTNNQSERERTVLEDIINRDEVAGIIAEATKSNLPNFNLPLFREIQRKNIPILFINSYYPNLKAPHVSLNDRAAGKAATSYLIEKGHKRIGGIFKLDDGQGAYRYEGYAQAFHEAGLQIDDSRIIWVDTEDLKHLEELKEKFVNRLRDCSAVVAYNDEVAFGVVELLKEEGIRIPEDISFVGIDNSELAVIGDVSITSIPHPMEKLGEKAAANLIEMIHDGGFDGTYEFDVSIIERESVLNLR